MYSQCANSYLPSLAIPAVTRYVADFLGISNLVRSETNPGAKYSENEIYQHITNCQVFLSYNIDETKLLKRRQAFKSSASFLFELAKKGNVYEATRWPIPRWLSGKLQGLWHLGRQKQNPMTQLGFKVAQQVYANDGDAGETAAIMLLIALDSAYNSVLAVSEPHPNLGSPLADVRLADSLYPFSTCSSGTCMITVSIPTVLAHATG